MKYQKHEVKAWLGNQWNENDTSILVELIMAREDEVPEDEIEAEAIERRWVEITQDFDAQGTRAD